MTLSKTKSTTVGIPIICAKCDKLIGRTGGSFVLGGNQFVSDGKIIDTLGCNACRKLDGIGE